MDEFAQLDLDAHLGASDLDPWPSMQRLVEMAFHQVPAYRPYLEGLGHAGGPPASLEAFGRLPLMTKKDYIQSYALKDRVAGGDLQGLIGWRFPRDRPGHRPFGLAPNRMNFRSQSALSRCSGTVSGRMRKKPWRWSVLPWATGWAAFLRPPAAGIWPERAIP